MQRIFLISLFLIFSLAGIAQETEPTGQNVVYQKEKHGGILLHSNGLGAFYRSGTHLTAKTKRMWEIEIAGMKHPKEVKVSNTAENSQSFVFGKLNTLTVTRGGFGLQKRLHGKDGVKGVEVRYHYFAGPTIGFAKPVYLEVRRPAGTGTDTRKYDPDEHRLENIVGKGPASRGISEIKPYPGGYGKFGLTFEYSGNYDTVKGIETGVVVDFFAKTVPVMAFTRNYQVFTSFYIALVFGNKHF